MKKFLILLIMLLSSIGAIGSDTAGTVENGSSSSNGSTSGNSDGYEELFPEESIPEDKIPDEWKPEVDADGVDIDDITGYKRNLIKTYTVKLDAKVDIRIPLEIAAAVDLTIDIAGNERKTGKFDVTLTKAPKDETKYHIFYINPDNPSLGGANYVLVDIDGDGLVDTYINSQNITSSNVYKEGTTYKFKENEYVVVGDNIRFRMATSNGNISTYKKTIYMTVEMGVGVE